LHRDEDPIGDWTLRVIDAYNPEQTGSVVHWTLNLWGEIAEDFDPDAQPIVTPVETSSAAEQPTETTTSIAETETASASPSDSTSSSPIESGTSTPAADPIQTPGNEHADEELEVSPVGNGTNVPEHIVSSGSTIAYISVGSLLILAAAGIAYVAKRKSWADKGYKEPPMSTRTEGYEFDLFADDDDSEAEEDNEDDTGSHATSPMLGRDKGKGKMVASEPED
jgi:Proprotein convertase P-domain